MVLTTRKFREWCRKARKLWPLDKPVRVRRVRLGSKSPASAYCYDAGDYSVIVIDKKLGKQATWDALAHEWAHLRRDEYGSHDAPHHDDAFWLELGAMYRAWERNANEL